MLDRTLTLGIGLGLGLAAGLTLHSLPVARGGDLTPRAERRLDRYRAKAVRVADRKGIVAGGVAAATVVDNEDPEGFGRVKVRFPWDRDGEILSEWARVVATVDEAGFFALPEPGDEVLVSFVHGDIRLPVVIGALWNGEDHPPPPSSQR